MVRNFMWTDDRGQLHTSTEVFDAADVTTEMLAMATTIGDRWFADYVCIDWHRFFRDLSGSVIPSTGRELDLGEASSSPAMQRIQRHIQKRRMASLARWKLIAAHRTSGRDPGQAAPLHLVVAPPG